MTCCFICKKKIEVKDMIERANAKTMVTGIKMQSGDEFYFCSDCVCKMIEPQIIKIMNNYYEILFRKFEQGE